MRKLKTGAGQYKSNFQLQDVVTKVVPAPTDGWDAISPLAGMDPKRAPILTNWTPRPGWVELRSGYSIWATTGATYTTGSAIETIMVYRAAGTEKMFAASGGKIFDCSTQFATPTAVVTGLQNNRWNYVNFTPSGAPTVIQLVNGQDSMQMYNGTVWSVPSITGLPGALTTANIRNIFAQKQRLWYILNGSNGMGSTIVAFMPIQAVTGPIAGSIDLGSLLTKGSWIQAMADWTIDGGAGPNDYAVFISNKGQAVIYQGTDPTSANTWSLVGVFDLPAPIGDRCATKVGSDVGIITLQGVIPLSSALPFDPSADRSIAITSRIQNAMAQYANLYNGNFGWQLITFPLQTLMILNIPLSTNAQQVQAVMNTITGAWALLTGWNANCFELFNNLLYFGDNQGNVNLAYSGGVDLFSPIAADMQCAFNYFDDPGRVKRMTMVQPLLTTSGTVSPFLGVDTDFASNSVSAPVTTLGQGNVLWDVALWDVGLWPTGQSNFISFLSVEAIGHAMAVRMKINFTTLTSTSGVFDFGTFDNAKFDSGSGAAPLLQCNAFNTIMEMGGWV